MRDDDLPHLLSYQSAWNKEPAEIALCEKSRRIGLSWADAAERVGHAAAGKGNVFYMSYNKDMTETYILDCADWARRFGRACSEIIEDVELIDEREIKKFRIDFPSGKSIVALTSNPRTVRSKGKPGDIVIVDEAAFCDDLDELLKAAVAVTQWGGKVRIISTHNGAENPFNELITDIRAGKVDYAVHRITLDDAIAAGLARRICTVKHEQWHPGYARAWRDKEFRKYRNGEDAEEELLCVPKKGSGTWLSAALVESRMVDAPVLRWSGSAAFNLLAEPLRRAEIDDWLQREVDPLLALLDPTLRHVFGMDFARSGDLSVIMPLEIGQTLRRRCPFMIELHNVPHTQQAQIVRHVGRRLPRLSAARLDGTGNGSFVAEDARDAFGSLAEPVLFTEAWYRERMPPYKAALEDEMLTLPRDDGVLSDHRAAKVVKGVPRLPEGKTDGMRHGDSLIAGVLAWQASCADHVEYAFHSAAPDGRAEGTVDPWALLGPSETWRKKVWY